MTYSMLFIEHNFLIIFYHYYAVLSSETPEFMLKCIDFFEKMWYNSCIIFNMEEIPRK